MILIIIKLVSSYFEFPKNYLRRYITHSKDSFFPSTEKLVKTFFSTHFSMSGNMMKHRPLCFIFYENVWRTVPNRVWKRFVSLIHELAKTERSICEMRCNQVVQIPAFHISCQWCLVVTANMPQTFQK